ncbi:ArsR/SmtB family transcription factor [Sporolactobacillus nakayamae]|uniref:Cadmium-sensing regulator, CadC n=1 Tax=Sporolactobacillus nakayamae TaxID=269670 RepID=A0A1I2N0N6_9BACL|nr:metalloregulator ArsR/SmtB family transcription factor [Sporolactobacillus nakayamae]SFF97424.1 cadmium-sensing regulator, CadC [Sporolactobacillus nakayamae]
MNKPQDVCEVTCIHKDRVMRVRKDLEKNNPNEIADLFKILADQTRITIVHALALEKELCVCDVCAIVGCSKATASHHLRLLKKIGFAQSRKDGKFVYYSLVDDYVRQLVHLAFRHQASKEIPNSEAMA